MRYKSIHLVSCFPNSGKSSIAIALSQISRRLPFKPISITSDIVTVSNNFVPWSVCAQLQNTKMYSPLMNPILLVPISNQNLSDKIQIDKEYSVYILGKFYMFLSGEEILSKFNLFSHIISDSYSALSYNSFFIIEGVGSALENNELFRYANNSSFDNNSFRILVYDSSHYFDFENVNFIEYISHYVNGVIVTKYMNETDIEKITAFFQYQKIPIIASIPFYSKAVNISSNFTEWSNFVSERINTKSIL